jgi:choline kinase
MGNSFFMSELDKPVQSGTVLNIIIKYINNFLNKQVREFKLKAILLAGGRGTRAKPFTEYFPKAMFPLNGRPIIDYIVRYLAQFSQINEIIIVCDFDNFGKQIINYFE